MSLKVSILSLGCPRNLVDSEIILGRIKQKGFAIAQNISDADIAIINTCSFIKEAKEESIDVILDACELKKKGKIKKIIVAGCLTQQYGPKLIKELPEVDAFVGRLSLDKASSRFLLTPAHYAYLKIAEGCDNRCSYCVIPQIKGSFKSRTLEDILKEVKNFDQDAKIKELNLIGQDITSYGKDLKSKIKLASLLKSVLKNSRNIQWFRLLYLHPAHIDDELIELIKSEKRICKYIDLPIQHISDRLLKLMNRKLSREKIVSLIDKIRREIPGVVIRTSVIVGFPSETEKEFKELLNFIEETKFERLGAFIYSKEENTLAFNFKGHISERIKKERFDAVMSLQQKVALDFNRSLIGRSFDVLIDEKCYKGSIFLGRTFMDAPEVDGEVFVKAKDLSIGDFTKIKITDSYEYDLAGEPT